MLYFTQRIRPALVVTGTVALYIWLCYLLGQAELFVTHTLVRSVLQVGLCILLLPLLSIELQQYPTKLILRWILLLLAVNLLLQ